jgi:hypothetical protein
MANVVFVELADDSLSYIIDLLSWLDLLVDILLLDCNIVVLFRWQKSKIESEK